MESRTIFWSGVGMGLVSAIVLFVFIGARPEYVVSLVVCVAIAIAGAVS